MNGQAVGTTGLDPRLLAVLWTVGAAVAWACVGVFVRYLGGRVPVTDLSFYRSVSGVLIMLPVIWPHRRTIAVATFGRRTMGLFALRGALLFCGQASFYFALAYIPLGEATVLNATTPVFVAVLAALVLKERVGAMRWAMVALGFVGVLVILRPGVAIIDVAAPFALLAALLFGSASIINKILSRTEPPSRIVFFTNILVGAVGAIPFIFIAVTPAWSDVPLIAALCLFGTLAQYCIARSFSLADASFVGPIDFLRVPVAALAGWLLFAELPDIWMWLGAAVIFVSIVGLLRGGSGRAPQDPAP